MPTAYEVDSVKKAHLDQILHAQNRFIEDLAKKQTRLPADQLLASPFGTAKGQDEQTGTPVTQVPSAAVGAVSQPAVRPDPDLLATGIVTALGIFLLWAIIRRMIE